MTNLVEQAYWDSGYRRMEFSPLAPDHFIRRWIQDHVPAGSGSCLEVGCFPGIYLAAFGDLGYELHGIDLTPRIESDMPGWLAACGYRLGELIRDDFNAHAFGRLYDVVCSFGFIEHFTDWHVVLRRHAALVRPGGFLVVEAPNMAGLVQRVLRQLLDPADFARHCPAAMYPDSWKEAVEAMGFEVLFAGAVGGFDFWCGPLEGPGMKRELAAFIEVIRPILAARSETRSQASAGYLGLIARRRPDGAPVSTPAIEARLAAISKVTAARDAELGEAASLIARLTDHWFANRDRQNPGEAS